MINREEKLCKCRGTGFHLEDRAVCSIGDCADCGDNKDNGGIKEDI